MITVSVWILATGLRQRLRKSLSLKRFSESKNFFRSFGRPCSFGFGCRFRVPAMRAGEAIECDVG